MTYDGESEVSIAYNYLSLPRKVTGNELRRPEVLPTPSSSSQSSTSSTSCWQRDLVLWRNGLCRLFQGGSSQ